MSAATGGGGAHIKEDRFSGFQEEMGVQHSPSLQGPAGTAQMAPAYFQSKQLYQKEHFGCPQCDISCLVRPP